MKNYKVLIVAANYYPEISEELKKRAKKVKKAHTDHEEITVPGIFEIPVIISRNIDSYDGFVALGCVIKGKTPHFKLISKAVTNAIMNLSITHKKPIGNGIITALNSSQATQRSGDPELVLGKNLKKGKGREAAKAVASILEI